MFARAPFVALFVLSSVAAAAAVACSSTGDPAGSDPGAPTTPGGSSPTGSPSGTDTTPSGTATTPGGSSGGPTTTTTNDDTWASGKEITGTVEIAAGVTVTIAPGAAISTGGSASVIVKGTLVIASAAGTHAKIGTKGWQGITVASGGKLTADGLDVSGAAVAVRVQGGGDATFDHGDVVGTPFQVEKGGTLSTSHANVTKPTSSTNVEGNFTASYLDYDEDDFHAIIADDPSAVVSIEDSTFHSTGSQGPTAGPDLLTVSAAAKFHLAYSDVTGAHCGFHFTGGDVIEIDHVNVHTVTNGADLWGSSSTGTHSITNSNFTPMLFVAFDEAGSNGSITVDGCYVPGDNRLKQTGSKVTITNPSAAPIADAHPR